MAYTPLTNIRKKGKDLSVQRFGRLVAKKCLGRKEGKSGKYMKTWWLCVCDCGNEHEVGYSELTGGKTKSCGCFRQHWLKEASITHAMTYTSEYAIWCGMKRRCEVPTCSQFKDWGGRGIKVCEEWTNSFEAFFDYVGPRPTTGHSIHRIDNDGNYEPGNVKWATRKEQAANKRPCKLKPMCAHGHKHSPENTRINRLGHRVCRTCERRWNGNKANGKRALTNV